MERGERIGLLLAFEGVEPFGYETWPVDVFWELGLRMAGLTWNRRNPYADGAAERGGLSRLGRSLLERMAERGLILDLAHASEQLFRECIEAYTGRLLVTHAGCRALNDHPRNLSDAQLRELGDRDGLFGLMLHPLAIGAEERTIARAIDHLEHAAELIGPERLCLAGDWSGRIDLVVAGPMPDGLMPPGPRGGLLARRARRARGLPESRRCAPGAGLAGRAARRRPLREPRPLPARGAPRLG